MLSTKRKEELPRVPQEVCHETSEGSNVFVREWSKATVTLNCSNWSSSITLK
jgi:hypothetical protein|eukprot:COSAG06_NODE_200_length_20386_cov_35.829547_4_plen_52_part_00